MLSDDYVEEQDFHVSDYLIGFCRRHSRRRISSDASGIGEERADDFSRDGLFYGDIIIGDRRSVSHRAEDHRRCQPGFIYVKAGEDETKAQTEIKVNRQFSGEFSV